MEYRSIKIIFGKMVLIILYDSGIDNVDSAIDG